MLETLIILTLGSVAAFLTLVLARFITDWVRELVTINELMHEIEELERTLNELRRTPRE